jgi:hypothetical protein
LATTRSNTNRIGTIWSHASQCALNAITIAAHLATIDVALIVHDDADVTSNRHASAHATQIAEHNARQAHVHSRLHATQRVTSTNARTNQHTRTWANGGIAMVARARCGVSVLVSTLAAPAAANRVSRSAT